MASELVIKETSLPSLIERAGQRLLEARTSAEVLEAKQIAEFALHHAKVTRAANESHADCLRIITRTEIIMANAIDRGQASGELARNGQHGEAVQTSDSLGVDRRRIAEWREIRDAGEEVVEAAIESALAEGRPPTKADIQKHVRGTFGTGENEWYTPAKYVDAAREVMGGIDLDPASSAAAQQTVKAEIFFDQEANGLENVWRGRVWLNPPYAQPAINQFVTKMVDEVVAQNVTAGVMLTHNYTDTAWFQLAAAAASAICFTRGRVKFEGPNGEVAAPTQGQAFFYFGNNERKFAEIFSQFGFVVTSLAA